MLFGITTMLFDERCLAAPPPLFCHCRRYNRRLEEGDEESGGKIARGSSG